MKNLITTIASIIIFSICFSQMVFEEIRFSNIALAERIIDSLSENEISKEVIERKLNDNGIKFKEINTQGNEIEIIILPYGDNDPNTLLGSNNAIGLEEKIKCFKKKVQEKIEPEPEDEPEQEEETSTERRPS